MAKRSPKQQSKSINGTRVFMLPNKLKYPRAKDLKPKNFMKMIDI
jgi:hypothetical protein